MSKSFYEQIEEEEAVRLALTAPSRAELKERAEQSRVQFYLRNRAADIDFGKIAVFALIFVIIGVFEQDLMVAVLLSLIILELNWRGARRAAEKKLSLWQPSK